jgi:hypothetical protein
MKIKSFVAFLTLPVDADVKSKIIFEKAGTVPRLLPQTHNYMVF